MDIIPQLNLIIWVYALSFASSIALGIILYFRKKSKGAYFLAIFQFLTSFWTIGALFDTLTHDIAEKMFWSQVSYIGITTVPLLFLAFSLDFAQYYKWLKWKYFSILLIVPAITMISALTNNYHHFLWESISVDPTNGLGHYVYGPMFWIYAAYSYVILITAIVLLFMGLRKFPVIYANQLLIFVLASIFPFVGNIIYVFKINPIPGLDWTPISFMISGALIAVGIYVFKVFDLFPIAQRKILETIQDAVAVVDQKQRIIMTNPSFVSSFCKDDTKIMGESIFSTLKNFEDIYTRLIRGSKTKLLEYKFGDQTYEFTYNSIDGRKNIELGMVLVFRNITEHIENQNSLILSNKNLGQEIKKSEELINDLSSFSHMVAHDLKSPLNGILGLSELILVDVVTDPDDFKSIIAQINNATTKMSQIIDELLLLSTVRLKDIKMTQVKMEKVVNDSIKRMDHLIEENQVEISIPSKWPKTIGYGPWIEEVWSNLISNAIKYGGNPPTIELGFYEHEPAYVWFWVKDNGDGLAPDKQEIIFDEFTRVNEDKEGHGLGLSIVNRIVQKCGGSVKVHSENKVGAGSIFSFSLKKA